MDCHCGHSLADHDIDGRCLCGCRGETPEWLTPGVEMLIAMLFMQVTLLALHCRQLMKDGVVTREELSAVLRA